MTLIEQQIATLQQKHPGALAERLPSGAYLIQIPGIRLPSGWNHQEVTVNFLAPAGYPAAQPDCFWVDKTLRLAENDTIPQNTNDTNPIPEVGMKGTWFSWHLQNWSPNQGSLLTFLNVVKQRLAPAR